MIDWWCEYRGQEDQEVLVVMGWVANCQQKWWIENISISCMEQVSRKNVPFAATWCCWRKTCTSLTASCSEPLIMAVYVLQVWLVTIHILTPRVGEPMVRWWKDQDRREDLEVPEEKISSAPRGIKVWCCAYFEALHVYNTTSLLICVVI